MSHSQASMFLLFIGGLAFGGAISSGNSAAYLTAAALFIAAVWKSTLSKK
jgi:hypothetical protein